MIAPCGLVVLQCPDAVVAVPTRHRRVHEAAGLDRWGSVHGGEGEPVGGDELGGSDLDRVAQRPGGDHGDRDPERRRGPPPAHRADGDHDHDQDDQVGVGAGEHQQAAERSGQHEPVLEDGEEHSHHQEQPERLGHGDGVVGDQAGGDRHDQPGDQPGAVTCDPTGVGDGHDDQSSADPDREQSPRPQGVGSAQPHRQRQEERVQRWAEGGGVQGLTGERRDEAPAGGQGPGQIHVLAGVGARHPVRRDHGPVQESDDDSDDDRHDPRRATTGRFRRRSRLAIDRWLGGDRGVASIGRLYGGGGTIPPLARASPAGRFRGTGRWRPLRSIDRRSGRRPRRRAPGCGRTRCARPSCRRSSPSRRGWWCWAGPRAPCTPGGWSR